MSSDQQHASQEAQSPQPQHQQPRYYMPQQRVKKRKKWPWVIGGVGLVGLVGCIGAFAWFGAGAMNVADEIDKAESPELFDGSSRKAYDAHGAEYSLDGSAAIYATEQSQTFLQRITPETRSRES